MENSTTFSPYFVLSNVCKNLYWLQLGLNSGPLGYEPHALPLAYREHGPLAKFVWNE
jgi:hypothetical protein